MEPPAWEQLEILRSLAAFVIPDVKNTCIQNQIPEIDSSTTLVSLTWDIPTMYEISRIADGD
jgi:hypothetical protein